MPYKYFLGHCIILGLFLFSSININLVNAQTEPVAPDGGYCFDNTFLCNFDLNTSNWTPNSAFSDCTSPATINPAACQGSVLPGDVGSPCQDLERCCLPCTTSQTPWGGQCNPNSVPDTCINSRCHQELHLCLKAASSISLGHPCRHNSECEPRPALGDVFCKGFKCTADAIDNQQGTNDTEICNRLGGDGDTLRQQCWDCYNSGGMWTALGCISRTKIRMQVRNFITLGISTAGGLALLLILYGSFLISTSAGDPQKVGEGKEIITAAIAGLVFIILSVVILNFIGFQILKIPGF